MLLAQGNAFIQMNDSAKTGAGIGSATGLASGAPGGKRAGQTGLKDSGIDGIRGGEFKKLLAAVNRPDRDGKDADRMNPDKGKVTPPKGGMSAKDVRRMAALKERRVPGEVLDKKDKTVKTGADGSPELRAAAGVSIPGMLTPPVGTKEGVNTNGSDTAAIIAKNPVSDTGAKELKRNVSEIASESAKAGLSLFTLTDSLRKSGEKGKAAGESKGGDEKDSRITGTRSRLTVVDRRTAARAVQGAKSSQASAAGGKDSREEGNGETRLGFKDQILKESGKGGSPQDDAGAKQMQVVQGAGELSARNTRTLTMTGNGGSFAAQLKDYLNNDIVKNSSIVLKDNDAGEIKLLLKPEHLGRVRIQLNLKDTHLAGRIMVDNNNVREMFERNMNHLEQAFRDSGFSNLSLEVSVGNGKQDGRTAEGFDFPLTSAPADKVTDSVAFSYLSGIGDNYIDLVV